MFIFVFDNKTKFMGTHAVVLVKTFPLAHHLLLAISYKTDIDETRAISFLGVQTDMILESRRYTNFYSKLKISG